MTREQFDALADVVREVDPERVDADDFRVGESWYVLADLYRADGALVKVSVNPIGEYEVSAPILEAAA